MRLAGRLPFAAVLAALGATAAPLAAQNFEGTIWFASSSADGSRADTLVQITKPGLLRLETRASGDNSEGMGAAILDLKANTITVLVDKEKMYMTRPIPKPSARAQSEAGTVDLAETGRTETVAGVTCKVYKATEHAKDGTTNEGEGCFAKGVGLQIADIFASWMGSTGMGSRYAAWEKLKSQDLHLLKATSFKNGKPDETLVAIKIDRAPVPASMFQPPAGYMQMQMPAMPTKTP